MRQKQTGFTLVEFLIAVVISMIAMVAVTGVYVAVKQTSRVQEMQRRITEDGRFGGAMMQRVISQAGYRETPASSMLADRIGVSGNVITVKFRTDGANQVVCDGSTPGAADQTMTIEKSGAKLVCRFDTNGDGDVIDAADGSVDWIAPAAAGAGNGTEVVDFSVKLGVDTGPAGMNENLGCGTVSGGVKPRDCIADAYVSALPGGVTAAQIVAIKVCWMLRSEATDASITRNANVKDCSNADIANSSNDRKLYRTFHSTVLLRNR